MPSPEARRKRSRRSRARSAEIKTVVRRAEVTNPYPPFAIFSDDEIESIHQASLDVLARFGMNFCLPEAVDILKSAGAEVDNDGIRVRFDPDFIMEK